MGFSLETWLASFYRQLRRKANPAVGAAAPADLIAAHVCYNQSLSIQPKRRK